MCLHGLAGHVDGARVAEAAGYAPLNNDPIPKQIDSIYENRLRQFLDEGQYRDLNLPKFYDVDRIEFQKDDEDLGRGYIQLQVHEVDGPQNRPLFPDVINKDTEYRPAKKGDVFGPSWKTFWFKVRIRVPKKWVGADQIIFQWDGGNEGLLYTTKGEPLQAFTGGEREEFILPEAWSDGEEHTFYIEMACNGMFGNGNGSANAPPDENRYFRLNKADLVLPNLEARALRYDFWIIGDAARELSGESWQKYKAREVCNRIMNTFDANDVKTISKCREIAQEYIGKHVDSDKVYHDKTAPANGKIDVFGIGHCHIDTAWLWPFGETRRKVVRSWTTQMDLMDRYPEYQFVASQAQQYKWLLQDHPDVFKRLQEKVSQNQFIPIGGSWVEHDTNIPNGESLVRQFVFGQRFFKSQFGQRCKTFWLPDTFGYSSQIPQLCRLAGLDRFLTQKLSWNNINNFPNTTFNWVALDGSQVVTHMPPANTYTADANFGDVKRSLVQHKNLTYDQTGLLVFGKGDGGGGPNPEMLEKLRRCRGLANTVGQLPTVHLGTSVDEYFDQLLERSEDGKSLVSWVGELYFEFHRGTYTSQALVKKLMRKSEIHLHDLEYFATLASILKPDKYKYPTKKIHDLWENVLLCQFHDVLPGSCIEMVYKMDVHPMLKKVIADAEKLTFEVLQVLQGKGKKGGDSSKFELISTMQWDRKGVFRVPKTLTQANEDVFHQESAKHDYVYAEANDGGAILPSKKSVKYAASVKKNDDSTFTLENGKLRAIIDGGVIKSLYDVVNDREVLDLKTGRNTTGANQLVLFEDTPLSWQAWDTEVFSLDKYKYLSSGEVSINESGPLRSSLFVVHKISEESSIQTIISLDGLESLDDPSMIEFDCKVDWNESRKFLKVEFPVDVHSDYASYETQFGITRRPTHYNTTWDVAKFEVCHHKFADYSDHSYGVSVINDSKYGFSTHGNLMRLSLLRSPKEPDAHADMGKHHFKYAIYPHTGALNAKTVELAYNFNFDLISPYFVNSGSLDSSLDLIRIKGDDSLVLSHVKRAEDDVDVSLGDLPIKVNRENGTAIVVRVYESLGGRARGKLVSKGKKVLEVYKVNLLEDELERVKTVESSSGETEIPLDLRAFEVVSYKIIFG